MFYLLKKYLKIIFISDWIRFCDYVQNLSKSNFIFSLLQPSDAK